MNIQRMIEGHSVVLFFSTYIRAPSAVKNITDRIVELLYVFKFCTYNLGFCPHRCVKYNFYFISDRGQKQQVLFCAKIYFKPYPNNININMRPQQSELSNQVSIFQKDIFPSLCFPRQYFRVELQQ